MFLVLLQLNLLGQVTQLAIHTDAYKALLRDIGEQALVLAFAPGYNRRQDLQPRLFGILQDPVHHLLHGL
ncbi:hypothetical protein D3C71_2046740 [compost metagenome]